MEPVEMVVPWSIGQPITGRSRLVDIGRVASFGAGDSAYEQITELLAKRNCITVDNLIDDWTAGELSAYVKGSGLKLTKHRSAYIRRKLHVDSERGLAIVKDEKHTGGDTSQLCRKVVNNSFNWTKWQPDALVYAVVPHANCQDFIEPEDEKLYLDLLWLALQADPEPSIGDYLPSGMENHLSRLHKRLKLAPFKPAHYGALNQTDRQPPAVIKHKVNNGRFYACKRIVLSEEFKSIFSEKVQGLLTFVPVGSEQLIDNARNDAMRHFMKLARGEATKTPLTFPPEGSDSKPEKPTSEKPAAPADKENGQQEPPAAPPPPAPPQSFTAAQMDLMDGLELGADDYAFSGVPQMPKKKGSEAGTSAPSGATKKEMLKHKREAARGAAAKPAAKKQPAAKKPKRAAIRVEHSSEDESPSGEDDSSDEEDSSRAPKLGSNGRMVVDSSDDDEAEPRDERHEPPRPAGTVPPPPPKPPPPPPLKQTKLAPKIKLCELATDDPHVTSDAVGDPLTAANVVSRFVFVPAAQFGVEGIGGWIAVVKKVARDKLQTTEVHFKDADGRNSKEYFKLSHIIEHFKPLS